MPNAVDVLNGVADLLAKLLFVKLHLYGHRKDTHTRVKYHRDRVRRSLVTTEWL